MPSPAEESARSLWIQLPAYFIATKDGREFLKKLEQFHLTATQEARAAERERCAKVVDGLYKELSKRSYPPPSILKEIAQKIREST